MSLMTRSTPRVESPRIGGMDAKQTKAWAEAIALENAGLSQAVALQIAGLMRVLIAKGLQTEAEAAYSLHVSVRIAGGQLPPGAPAPPASPEQLASRESCLAHLKTLQNVIRAALYLPD